MFFYSEISELGELKVEPISGFFSYSLHYHEFYSWLLLSNPPFGG